MVEGPAPAVTLRGVSKTFGAVRALVGATGCFQGGRASVIQGPNGSGKSTLLSIVGTLTRPTSGQVHHEGLSENRTEVRATLGWVGHESLCYGDLSGRENIELAARLHGLDPDRAFRQAVGRFELASFAERPVRTCSRGQRQRVALARALVHGPKLLLLDEPSTGLDVASTARLLGVIGEEVARGSVVVVVTHDRDLAAALEGPKFRVERGRLIHE
jgi:ABC-type multidrug transport system ATPase subunit